MSHSASRDKSRRSWPSMGACPVSAGVRTPLRWAFCSRAKSKKRSQRAAGAVPAYPRPPCHVAVTSTVIPAPTFEGHGTPARVPACKVRIGFLLRARTHKSTQGAKAAKPSDTGPERIEKSSSGKSKVPLFVKQARGSPAQPGGLRDRSLGRQPRVVATPGR